MVIQLAQVEVVVVTVETVMLLVQQVKDLQAAQDDIVAQTATLQAAVAAQAVLAKIGQQLNLVMAAQDYRIQYLVLHNITQVAVVADITAAQRLQMCYLEEAVLAVVEMVTAQYQTLVLVIQTILVYD
jgi:hypothetical protein